MRVSLLIPAYKRPHLLRWQLESLVPQREQLHEIIVLNDGIVDGTEAVCQQYSDRLPIKYMFTGGDVSTDAWRVQGFCNNIGIKASSGDIIIIACAEMYHINESIRYLVEPIIANNKSVTLCKCDNIKDDNGMALNALMKGQDIRPLFLSIPRMVNCGLPFVVGMLKESIVSIGGFDEDFVGVGWEDNDIMERLCCSGCSVVTTDAKVVHLYHERLSTTEVWSEKYNINFGVYKSRQGQTVRNVGREWGVSNRAAKK